MNILYLAHRIPYPPNKGDKLRAFRQIERLSREHRVWCVCFVDRPGDFQYVEDLRRHCAEVIAVELRPRTATLRGAASLLFGGMVTTGYYACGAMREQLRQLKRRVRFDAIVAFSSSMARYARMVPARRRILDLCDCDSQKWLAYADRHAGPMRRLHALEGRRLARMERACLNEFDAAIVITDSEAATLAPFAPPGRLHVVGNGVHLPDDRLLERDKHRFPPIVGFVGVMDYWPNVDAVKWFVEECWPAIRQAHPAAVFRIVGRCPTRGVRRLAKTPGVQVVGEVDDVGWEVRRFDVSVAPLRIARGLQNKVLEAMAYAKPIVLTTGAAEGIIGRSGEHFLTADSPQAFIQHVRILLDNQAERERLGAAARSLVAARYRWDDVLDAFDRIVTSTAVGWSWGRPRREVGCFQSTIVNRHSPQPRPILQTVP
ncbi:MAG: TIGR03087 family PEP-CTERM/XrtA system glycosyltransferase [Planctomycetota bacterium]